MQNSHFCKLQRTIIFCQYFSLVEHCYDDSNTFTVVELSVVIMMLSATTVVLNVDTAVKYIHSCLHRDSGAGTRTTGLRNPLFN